MDAQDFIVSRLDDLKKPLDLTKPAATDLESEIVRLILSKKFRKYSAGPELVAHIKASVAHQVENNEPIKIVYPHGGYKLWRLDEAPEVDWAELFAPMYYTKWLKPICEIYEPGVELDFFVDDYIVEKNNISKGEINKYLETHQKLLGYIKHFQPKNLRMEVTLVSSLFESETAFWDSVNKNLAKMSAKGLPRISDKERKTVELNVRPVAGQELDEHWQEEYVQLHRAYTITKNEPGYYNNRIDKIVAFTQPFSPMCLGLGTTKNSIMKFWIGVGVLKKSGGAYQPTILSLNQLRKVSTRIEQVRIDGLNGKNFSKIRIID